MSPNRKENQIYERKTAKTINEYVRNNDCNTHRNLLMGLCRIIKFNIIMINKRLETRFYEN